jgi:hypothetical protein
MAHRQRPEQHGIRHREDCRVRADAERKRQSCHRGERWATAQPPEPIPEVAGQIVEPRQAALITHRVHAPGDPAGVDRGDSLGVVRLGTLPPRVIRAHLEVEAQFLFELGVSPVRSQASPKADDPLTQPGQAGSPSRRTR